MSVESDVEKQKTLADKEFQRVKERNSEIQANTSPQDDIDKKLLHEQQQVKNKRQTSTDVTKDDTVHAESI